MFKYSITHFLYGKKDEMEERKMKPGDLVPMKRSVSSK
jgi:hypothetical protein